MDLVQFFKRLSSIPDPAGTLNPLNDPEQMAPSFLLTSNAMS